MAALEEQSFLGSLVRMKWIERDTEVELLLRGEGRRYTGGGNHRHADECSSQEFEGVLMVWRRTL